MDPITRIRQIIDTDPGSWLAECFRRYIHGAHKGLTMEAAFGLTVGPGGAPWWREEALRQRDNAIRELANQHFGSLDLNSQADAILQAIRRYRNGRWRFDQFKECVPANYADTRSGHLYTALRKGDGAAPESKRHLRRILAGTK